MPKVRGGDYLNLPVVWLSLAGENRLGTPDMPNVLCRNPKSICCASGTRRICLAPLSRANGWRAISFRSKCAGTDAKFGHRGMRRKTKPPYKKASLEALPGTYALLLSTASDAEIRVGRLGDMRLQSGFYVYVGSALGPGGVRARVNHHMRASPRHHWHIDYVRPQTTE